MDNTKQESGFKYKLNMKRTFIIGFAFFGILLMWQVYDSYMSPFLTELFKTRLGITDESQVQYLVGIMMALDNIAALIMMPIFGRLSDKTNSRFGKRMPYIVIGTVVCAIAFPFIPIAFEANSLVAVIILMAITVFFGMMYRNPAVALMPDLTPKPLRSKANGIINIMGYFGGAVPLLLGIFLSLKKYLGIAGDGSAKDFPGFTGNIWIIEIPFLLASVLMIASLAVLFFSIKENKIKESIKEELDAGEKYAEVVDEVKEEGMSKANLTMFWLILAAEFFWFMADNGVGTFMQNYTLYQLHADTTYNMYAQIAGGLMSVLGFAFGGIIAGKIGRKYTLWGGLGLTIVSYLLWFILSRFPGLNPEGSYPIYLYVVFVLKGFGMALVHVNSFPMIVELCPASKVGAFTGYYYASSMTAQTITPILLGLLMLIPKFGFDLLPLYALGCMVASFVIFAFVKNAKNKKIEVKKGLEAFDTDD